jgi:hypothetical protein
MKRLKRGDLAWMIFDGKQSMVMIMECSYEVDVYHCVFVAVAHHAAWLPGCWLERVVP